MKITEHFATVQGEGPTLGTPSLFIRTGGCNLRCQFRGEACDTPYAVFTSKQLDKKNPTLKHGYGEWKDYSAKQLFDLIEAQRITNIVWTGGEPMLFQEGIGQVIEMLDLHSKRLYTHEFETNGTVIVNQYLQSNQSVRFNVSVKLVSSNQENAYKLKTINNAALFSFPVERSIYKFVISNPTKDLKEIKRIFNIKALPIFLMPEGLTREDVIKNSPAVVQMAIENGWRFTPREHIVIWDQKKGV